MTNNYILLLLVTCTTIFAPFEKDGCTIYNWGEKYEPTAELLEAYKTGICPDVHCDHHLKQKQISIADLKAHYQCHHQKLRFLCFHNCKTKNSTEKSLNEHIRKKHSYEFNNQEPKTCGSNKRTDITPKHEHRYNTRGSKKKQKTRQESNSEQELSDVTNNPDFENAKTALMLLTEIDKK